MPIWNADQYLKFAEERTQPCRDLAARVSLQEVKSAIDLGCGPGNSTAILAGRWPGAQLSGLDNSASMIDVARRDYPGHEWIVSDITEWASSDGPRFDLVFSNAALQWVPGHTVLYPRLLARVSPGGAFAMQIPCDINAPAHQIMRELLPGINVREWHAHSVGFYYDLLAPPSRRVEVWETEYQHVMPNAEAIVEWYKGTGLRPFLEALKTAPAGDQFLADYLVKIRQAYPPRADGNILFPFRRLFVVAYRK